MNLIMLAQLTIRNYGLIDAITIDFTQKFNILTGETGAGKSILIDALRCVLGERFDSASIRNAQNPCIIEAVFDIGNTPLTALELFKEFLTAEDSQLIIQRSFTATGQGRIKINGLSVNVAQLKLIGNHLIDFHGPHDHQMLLDAQQHLPLLDSLCVFKDMKENYTRIFLEYTQTSNALKNLNALAQTHQRDLETLSYQLKELEAVPLSTENDLALAQEQIKLNNAQKLHEHLQHLLEFLDNEESGVHTLLRKAFSPLKSITHIDTASSVFLDQLSSIQNQTNDFIAELNAYAQKLNFDEKTAQRIHDQCDAYKDIKRKYGPSLEDAQRFYTGIRQKLDLIKNFEHNDQQLRDTLKSQESELSKVAQQLTQRRQKTALDLKITIEKELKELGILHVLFETRFEKIPFNVDGQDRITFYISPNAGEDLKPLAQIVSSGEAARLMLALKKALIKVDPIPVLIFDEIDAQIGGRLGTITGKKLKELSKHRQVILITHLPQIAAFADAHFKISKSVKNGRATTDVSLLEGQARIEEIAQMMSGTAITPIAISHAQDMLKLGSTDNGRTEKCSPLR